MVGLHHYTLLYRTSYTTVLWQRSLHLGVSAQLYICMVVKAGILCLRVQMTLLHRFPEITVLKNAVYVFLNTLQYNRRVRSRFSLARNLFFRICSPLYLALISKKLKHRETDL
jgi:hypothetical protein